MPAAAIIVPLAVSAASTAATTALVGATLTATLGVVGGAIVTGAIGGAIGGAITGGIEGGDIGMDVLTGAVQGGVGAGVSAAVPSSGITNEIATDFPGISAKTASSIGTGISRGVGALAGGTAAGLAGGQNFGKALTGGAVSGIATGVASGLGNQFLSGDQAPTQTNPSSAQLERAQNRFGALPFFQENPNQPPPFNFQSFSFNPNLPSPDLATGQQSSFLNQQIQNAGTGALKQGIQTGLNDLLGPSPSGGGQSTTANFTTPPNFNPTPTDVALGGGSPSVAALAQALRTVPDLGYSPGGPVFGSDASKANRKVWNKASLRVTDDQNQ